MKTHRQLRLLDRLAMSVFALALLGLVFVGVRTLASPPPFAFTQEAYLPDHPTVCPGNALTWHPQLVVRRAPTVLAIARSIWDVTRGMTVVPDGALDFFVWTDQDVGTQVKTSRSMPVPLLPPGVYEIRAGATAFNTDAAAYRLPFVIPGSCTTESGR
ncbi:hypothetical protein [Deinococcus sedimenti]|uniref:Uncharacterized protein n=1 Tax=Deinococcus sedimenti TaxID=1867090 RepID=A0ABQ2S984_9DEIO|nr:hypothetical protein [Deinococcus sedimenti]GGS10319.1 hypothetical protein GCM10008960_40570 [Deinococcus sedimenti]